MHFGVKLRAWRKAKGLTQKELAKAAGINVSYVSNLERNFSANKKGVPQPSRALCRKFAKVLNVDEAEVLTAAGYISEKNPKLPDFLNKIDWQVYSPQELAEIEFFLKFKAVYKVGAAEVQVYDDEPHEPYAEFTGEEVMALIDLSNEVTER